MNGATSISLRSAVATLGKENHSFDTKEPSPTVIRVTSSSTIASTNVMSDSTESRESTSNSRRDTPPPLRRRSSSWSLAKQTDTAEKGKRKSKEPSQGSPIEESNVPNAPQHEEADRLRSLARPAIQPEKSELLNRLSAAAARGNLASINLSRRGLLHSDVDLITSTITQCPRLVVLKLRYNRLGDVGASAIASVIATEGGHHQHLAEIDLGFNNIGENGCASLALHAVAGNYVLNALYLPGNEIREQGALALAGAILHGSGLNKLNVTFNKIGTVGVKALTRAIAEGEARTQLARQSSDAVAAGRILSIPTIQELEVAGTKMESPGFLSLANMVLTNFSLRKLNLCGNELDDNDIALFAQSITQNKNVPLEVLNLSFNHISCVGIECLMNAVWGSKTLREMRLDHNLIQDRGSQLAAVVLTSIDLELLDLGYNRIGPLGIKALMKSLSENCSLQSLHLSGIPLDPAGSKAVCYALAYNSSLRYLHIDSCSIGYASQRHIVAGIVSNQHASLRVVTGFRLGAISVTLGLPQDIEGWANGKILRFVAFMWQSWRKHQETSRRLEEAVIMYQNEEYSAGTHQSSDGQQSEASTRNEPADPKTVVKASKHALALLGDAAGNFRIPEPSDLDKLTSSPILPPNAVLLERDISGSLMIPSECKSSTNHSERSGLDTLEKSISPDSSLTESESGSTKKAWIHQWVREHVDALMEVSVLPFSDTDLFELRQYFYASIDDHAVQTSTQESACESDAGSTKTDKPSSSRLQPSVVNMQSEDGPDTKATNFCNDDQIGSAPIGTSKRRSEELDKDINVRCSLGELGPATKRMKNSKLRISCYPKVQEKLEALGSLDSREKALVTMRQLRFVEVALRESESSTIDNDKAMVSDREYPAPRDVEMVLMSLL